MSGMDDFKDLYIQTARERIQQLNDLLLKLETNPKELEIIQELMRTGHSLKGESAAMGYEKLATLAHVIEDLFTGIGNGELAINDQIMDELFTAVDRIEQTVGSIETNNTELETQDLVGKIKEMTGLKTEGFGKSDKSKPITQTAEAAAEPTPGQTETISTEPAPQNSTPEPNKPVTVAKTQEKISSVTMKVEKLDQMISISEELVLMKMKLKTNPIVLNDSSLKAEVHRLDRLVTDMQWHIMQARLFPISLAFHTLPRLVRDTAKKTGKSVRLEIEGEETTVDRTIIDHLTEPFVHMIRNAVDHGIETPEARAKTNKPAEAVIKMKAYTKENKFYVEVSDDGQGIDWQAVLKSAIKKGRTTEAESKNWTQKQIEQLLFMGGVSTNEVVTDVSGRGVGMSAVKEAIKKLGGSIEIKTEIGKGTTFVLKLPLTLAIMQALLVRVDRQTYAIPGNEVVRSIQIERSQIQSSANTQVIVVDGTRVPLYDLHELFVIHHGAQPQDEAAKSRPTVVLTRSDAEIVGCLVDKIVAEEEILVKQLGPLLKQSAYFSGATILADGSAAPIINLEGLKWKN